MLSPDDDGLTIPTPTPTAFTVESTFWTLLAYQHDGLADESEAARIQHLDSVRWFLWSRLKTWPGETVKRQFAYEIRMAHERFDRDLMREKEWLDYKAGRRSRHRLVVGDFGDWRSRRKLLKPFPPTMPKPWDNFQPSLAMLNSKSERRG